MYEKVPVMLEECDTKLQLLSQQYQTEMLKKEECEHYHKETSEARDKLENKVSKLEERLTDTIEELKEVKIALAKELALKEGKDKEICLPPGVTLYILAADYSLRHYVYPKFERGFTLVKDTGSKAYSAAAEFTEVAIEKSKPVVLDVTEKAKVHLGVAHGKALETLNPLFAKLDEVAKPYYTVVIEKVDEVTKPYQPKAKETYLVVKGAVLDVASKVLPAVQDAYGKYKEAVVMVVTKAKEGVLEGYVHAGNEVYIVNTLVLAPLLGAYLFFSSFRGKKKTTMKQPSRGVGSPGRPAFKPSTSPFRPTSKKNK